MRRILVEDVDALAEQVAGLHRQMLLELGQRLDREGVHVVDWDGTDSSGAMVSAGVYIYALESSDMVMTKKMILMK